ncbi:MAG: HAMP domain-containing sensor histidine kinase [Solirubrobacteraceae bacterium]|jgi:signal transduction histidine kinase
MRRLAALTPAAWRRPRRTARLRLTVLYTGLFLLSGTAALAIVYAVSAENPRIAIAVGPVGAVGSRLQALRAQVRAVRSAEPSAPAPPVIFPHLRDVALEQRSADLDHLLEVSGIALGLTALVSAVLGWFAAGRVLAPVREITATARTISAGSLHQRLALSGPEDEFKALGDTLDELLARLEAAFEAQRRFVANASHELRTPLTLERVLLQVALSDPDAGVESLRATCEELLAAGAQQERLLEALLTLASSERGLERRESLDLAGLAEQALRTPRPEIGLLSLEVRSSLEPATTLGDPALLQRLIANLLDNAVDYNVPDGHVTVATAAGAGRALLTVTNTGSPIDADQVERLFEPFQRLDPHRGGEADGHHGLGLSIVRAIAAAHDAELSAQARDGGGLTVTVRFPVAPAPREPEAPRRLVRG